MSMLIDRPKEEDFCVPRKHLDVEEQRTRDKILAPVTVTVFRAAMKMCDLTYGAGVWLKRLCIYRGRMDLLDVVCNEKYTPEFVSMRKMEMGLRNRKVTVREDMNTVHIIPSIDETIDDEYGHNSRAINNANNLKASFMEILGIG